MQRLCCFMLFLFFTANAFSNDCEKEIKISFYQTKYSQAFSITYFKDFKLVELNLPLFKDKFIVSDKKLSCTSHLPVITSHAQRIVATSTTHLPFLTQFQLEKNLVGFQGVNYINGFIHKIENINFVLNPEELLKLSPDVVIAYLSNLGSLEAHSRLKSLRKLGLPIVLNFDYTEKHPLARAEWVIYNSLFINKDKEAIQFFSKIESDYNLKKQSVKKLKKKKILVGSIVEGRWVMPGGMSDIAILILDAQGEMLFSTPNQETQQLSLEVLLSKKWRADLWMPQNTWKDKSELKKDQRYKMLNIMPIYNNDKILNKSGFNDYWQMGLARPDLLLNDLITLFHGDIQSHDKLVWYREIK